MAVENQDIAKEERTLPHFFCIGVQKAGTTSLHDILINHPEIYLPEAKEAHFFDREDRYPKGLNWWMDEFFHDYAGEKVMGVFTPDYVFFEEVPERLFKDCGNDIKIILILRHPVDRAQSHYFMEKRRGFETLSFEDAIEQESERIQKGRHELDHFSYMARGRYSEQLKRYLKYVKKENFMLLSFENDIKSNLDTTIQKIERFIGVEELKLDTDIKSNRAQEMKSERYHKIVTSKNPIKPILRKIFSQKTRYKVRRKLMRMNYQDVSKDQKITPEKRDELFERYFPNEIERITELTGADFSYWKTNNKQ